LRSRLWCGCWFGRWSGLLLGPGRRRRKKHDACEYGKRHNEGNKPFERRAQRAGPTGANKFVMVVFVQFALSSPTPPARGGPQRVG
jgi:hypothetical protein